MVVQFIIVIIIIIAIIHWKYHHSLDKCYQNLFRYQLDSNLLSTAATYGGNHIWVDRDYSNGLSAAFTVSTIIILLGSELQFADLNVCFKNKSGVLQAACFHLSACLN